MKKLIAFHGKREIKDKYVSRVKAHQKADEIVKGTYWQNGKGCAVGCTIEGDDHGKYETELGIPRIIAHVEDRIFEGLPNAKAKKFPLQFLSAVSVGADLSLVWPRFAVWLLVDKKDGVIKYAKTDEQRKVITDVAELYERVVKGEAVSSKEFEAAADAAAAYAYADAAAAAAADATAATAATAYAYAYAAYATAAHAYAYARNTHYEKCAKELIALLKAAPITS